MLRTRRHVALGATHKETPCCGWVSRTRRCHVALLAALLLTAAPTTLSFVPLGQTFCPSQLRSSVPACRRPVPACAWRARTNTRALCMAVEYGVDVPYAEAAYDPVAADEFFGSRPLAAMGRLAQLVAKSSGFITAIVLDKKLGREERMVERRSQELLELVTALGPTSIKVGQALSARTDLLPAAYAAGLTKLQDAVPPFPGELGRAVIEQELGIKIDEVFSELSVEPVASASVGQVYKGRLRETGEAVAVKVQRPGVLANVALDLFIMRSLAPLWKRVQEINTDLVGLVDTWGTGFVNELDYRKEAAATTAFSAAMRQRGLGAVFAPEVVPSLSSIHVLTTKWVDGERLAASAASDVPRLSGVALNAYLTMLLDTGTLHCDPHPGNLLRTPDGRLCILDWGMVIQVPADLQLSLLEFIANLSAENYEEVRARLCVCGACNQAPSQGVQACARALRRADIKLRVSVTQVPNDLVKLSFVPADKLEDLRASGLTVAIAMMLKLAGEGGGPKGAMQRMVEQNKQKYAEALAEFEDLDSPEATAVRQRLFREDWQKQMALDAMARGGAVAGGGGGGGGEGPGGTAAGLTQQIEAMQQQNADVFAIPDYFVYMSRAFATLEGIGLSSDPNYSILKECFPYLAARLLSDDSPRARGALRMLLYGTGDTLDLAKLQEMTAGLETYTVSTTSAESSRGMSDAGRSAAAEQLAAVVLAEDGNYLQSLLLHEAAVVLDTAVRDALSPPPALLRGISETPALLASVSPLLTPLTLPLELTSAAIQLQALDASDRRGLDNARILSQLAADAGRKTLESGAGAGRSGDVLAPAWWGAGREAALVRMGVRFGGSLAAVQAQRLRQRAGHGGGGGSSRDVSQLAGRLAVVGAEGLENLASAISVLDRDLAARSRKR